MKYTDQTAFDDMASHLLQQGQRSMPPPRTVQYGGCMYRNPSGLMCPVGRLIPEDEYKKSFEGKSAAHVQREVKCLSDVTTSLLIDMQLIHDTYPVEDWRDSIKRLAKRYDLSTKRALKTKKGVTK